MSLELTCLLQPIAEDHPCGIDCSFSHDFHAIKKAKIQDDPLLEQGDWISESKQADWAFIQNKSIELLTEKTKDIRLYTWLLEAWTHLYGFEGIAKALELTQQSLSHYWEHLHPKIEENDLDQRIGLLQGLINLIPLSLKAVNIVSGSLAYTLSDYEYLLHQQNQKLKTYQEDSSRETATDIQEQFEQALFQTSKSIQYQKYQQFLDISNQWQQLKDVLDHLMHLDAPSFASIDSQIETIHLTLKKIYKIDAVNHMQPEHAMTADIEMSTESMPSHHLQKNISIQPNFQPQQQGHLANREQAMHVLQNIADYFQENEPHSPVSYMLQKTIKWSQMPLHEWLSQVLKNENPLETVHELLGVQINTRDINNDG